MSKIGLYIGNSSFMEDDEEDFFINIHFNNMRQCYELDADLFDVVVIDNCLQKLENFYAIIENVRRLLKKEGEFIIILPDYRLYEKCVWPSKFNSKHLHSFSTNLTKEVVKRNSHWNVDENLIPMIKDFGFDNFEHFLDDNNYDYDKPVLVDQTKDGASCFIMIKSILKTKE